MTHPVSEHRRHPSATSRVGSAAPAGTRGCPGAGSRLRVALVAVAAVASLPSCVAAPQAQPTAYAQAPAPARPACGIQGYDLQPGTAVATTTISQADRPFMGFGQSPVPIASAEVLSAPCAGSLARSARPLGFRYTPRPGYLGTDSWVFRGCTARGQCVVQAALVTVAP